MVRLSCSLFVFALMGCGGDLAEPGEPDSGLVDDIDRSDVFFGAELMNIDIETPAASWERLRYEARTRIDLLGGELCSATPYGSAYDYQETTLTIDGARFEGVGLRKKGYGSQSTTKPSLKVDLSRYGAEQQYLSVGRFVLNNNKSDDTELRQCFSYRLMDMAGLPTPRCTFATVTVNGDDLGVFTVVEEVKKPFLERHFGSSTGNLYEGESNDFRTEFIGFDQDNNEENDTSRSDLERARVILEAATPESANADIASVVDLDQFYRHWAAEVMIWHRDGYAGNLNNFFFYADPADEGRFKFVPWGTDNVMRNETRATIPHSTLAFGLIPNLLYQTAEGQDRFYAELDAMMQSHWDQGDLHRWIDDKAALLAPHIRDVDIPQFQPEIDALKLTVTERDNVFAAARAEGNPAWEAGLRGEICRIEKGTVTGSVDAKWNSRSPADYDSGSGTLSMTVDGEELGAIATSGAIAGELATGVVRVTLRVITDDNERLFVNFNMPDPRFFDGVVRNEARPIISTAFNVTGFHQDLTTGARLRNIEFDHGTFEASAYELTEDGRVTFDFSAKVYER